MSSSPWTEERVKELTKLWGDGMSAGQIALRFAMTRNQIIAKVHRLKLPPRLTNQRFVGGPRKSVKPQKQERPRQAPVRRQTIFTCDPLPPSCETDVARMSLLELDSVPGIRNCRWPVGTPGSKDFGFCGDSVASGFPYCLAHCRRAFQPPMVRRRSPSPTASDPRQIGVTSGPTGSDSEKQLENSEA